MPQLQEEAAQLRAELQLRVQQVAALERDLAAANARLQNVAAAATGQPLPAEPAPAAAAAVVGGNGIVPQPLLQPQPAAQLASAAIPVHSIAPLAVAQQPVQLQPAVAGLAGPSVPIVQQVQAAPIAATQQPVQQVAFLHPPVPAAAVVDASVGLAVQAHPKPVVPVNGTVPGVAQQLGVSLLATCICKGS